MVRFGGNASATDTPYEAYLKGKEEKKEREPRPQKKKEQFPTLDAFLDWIDTLKVSEHKSTRATIVRYQKYHRPGFIKDCYFLLKEFMEGRE